MKKITLVCLMAVGAFTFQSCGSDTKSSDSTERAEATNEAKDMPEAKEDDAEFAVKAADGGMFEVAAGKLAEEKAQSQAVKDFGAMMVKDHGKAGEELKTIAASKNMTLPMTLGEDHQKHIDELAKLTGADFDKKYVSMMVDDHEDDVKKFKKASEDCKDADLKAFAAKTHTVVEGHLGMIKGIKESM